tara:strand:+ start:5803 stop:6090 length:288 start_codon:yes stop_codon:yes gene_type:complete
MVGMRHRKIFTLTNGQQVTIKEVAEKACVHPSTACCRLHSVDLSPETVFAKSGTRIKGGHKYVKDKGERYIYNQRKLYGMDDPDFVLVMKALSKR